MDDSDSIRHGGDSEDTSFSDWLKRKEEKRAEKLNKKLHGFKRFSINPVSKKQQKKLQNYKKARQSHYSKEENQKCKLCGKTKNLSIHHIAKRGSKIADESKFATLCLTGFFMSDLNPHLNRAEGCHGFVEANKGWARKNELLE